MLKCITINFAAEKLFELFTSSGCLTLKDLKSQDNISHIDIDLFMQICNEGGNM